MSPLARAVALVLPTVMIVAGIYGLDSGWAAFLLYHVGIIVVITWTRTWSVFLRGFSVARPTRVGLGATLGGVAAALAGATLMWWLWPWYAGAAQELAPALAALGLEGTAWLTFMAYHALVNPFIEEGYWRGVLGDLGTAGRGPRTVRGVARTDIWFAAYHAFVLARFSGAAQTALSVTCLVAVAVFWRWTVRRTGSLWPATLSHLAADASIMWVAWGRMD